MSISVIVPNGEMLAKYQRIASDLGGILQTNGRRSIINERLLKGYSPIRSLHKNPPLEAA